MNYIQYILVNMSKGGSLFAVCQFAFWGFLRYSVVKKSSYKAFVWNCWRDLNGLFDSSQISEQINIYIYFYF